MKIRGISASNHIRNSNPWYCNEDLLQVSRIACFFLLMHIGKKVYLMPAANSNQSG
jgi:hypothetical protein